MAELPSSNGGKIGRPAPKTKKKQSGAIQKIQRDNGEKAQAKPNTYTKKPNNNTPSEDYTKAAHEKEPSKKHFNHTNKSNSDRIQTNRKDEHSFDEACVGANPLRIHGSNAMSNDEDQRNNIIKTTTEQTKNGTINSTEAIERDSEKNSNIYSSKINLTDREDERSVDGACVGTKPLRIRGSSAKSNDEVQKNRNNMTTTEQTRNATNSTEVIEKNDENSSDDSSGNINLTDREDESKRTPRIHGSENDNSTYVSTKSIKLITSEYNADNKEEAKSEKDEAKQVTTSNRTDTNSELEHPTANQSKTSPLRLRGGGRYAFGNAEKASQEDASKDIQKERNNEMETAANMNNLTESPSKNRAKKNPSDNSISGQEGAPRKNQSRSTQQQQAKQSTSTNTIEKECMTSGTNQSYVSSQHDKKHLNHTSFHETMATHSTNFNNPKAIDNIQESKGTSPTNLQEKFTGEIVPGTADTIGGRKSEKKKSSKNKTGCQNQIGQDTSTSKTNEANNFQSALEMKEKMEKAQNNNNQIPTTPSKMESFNMCSGQPRYSISEVNKNFPKINLNIFKVNVRMIPKKGEDFKKSNYADYIRTFFNTCKSHDKDFKILPWAKKSKSSTTVNTITEYAQIPTDHTALDDYVYNRHVTVRSLGVSMIVCTNLSFNGMFKNYKTINGKKSIISKFKEKNIHVTQTTVETMGATRFIGYLQHAHPYLTNQVKTLQDIKKVLNIDDLVLEHYTPKVFDENGKLIGATMAFCIGAPEDIAYEVSDLLYQHWASIRNGELDTCLGEDSNLKKYLFIPFDGNKLPKADRAKLMMKHTEFRMHYKGLSLNETESVDKEFDLSEKECKELGLNKEPAPMRTTIRKIIQTWRTSDGNPLIWAIESATNTRQVMIVSKTHLEIVRSETANLFKLLHARPDFSAIVGTSKAYVDGYEKKSGKSGLYQDILQSTVLQISQASDHFPSLPEVSKVRVKRQPPILAGESNHKRRPNPYLKNNYMKAATQKVDNNTKQEVQEPNQPSNQTNTTLATKQSNDHTNTDSQVMSSNEARLHQQLQQSLQQIQEFQQRTDERLHQHEQAALQYEKRIQTMATALDSMKETQTNESEKVQERIKAAVAQKIEPTQRQLSQVQGTLAELKRDQRNQIESISNAIGSTLSQQIQMQMADMFNLFKLQNQHPSEINDSNNSKVTQDEKDTYNSNKIAEKESSVLWSAQSNNDIVITPSNRDKKALAAQLQMDQRRLFPDSTSEEESLPEINGISNKSTVKIKQEAIDEVTSIAGAKAEEPETNNVNECAEIDDEGTVLWSVIGKSPPNTRARKKKQEKEIYHTKHVNQVRNAIKQSKNGAGKRVDGLNPIGRTRTGTGNSIARRASAHTQVPSSSATSNGRMTRGKQRTSASTDDKTGRAESQHNSARSAEGRRRGV